LKSIAIHQGGRPKLIGVARQVIWGITGGLNAYSADKYGTVGCCSSPKKGNPITADVAPLVVGGNGSGLKSFKWRTLSGLLP